MFQVLHLVKSPRLTRNKKGTYISLVWDCGNLHFCENTPNACGCSKVTYNFLKHHLKTPKRCERNTTRVNC